MVNLIKGQWDDTHRLHGSLLTCKTLVQGNLNCQTRPANFLTFSTSKCCSISKCPSYAFLSFFQWQLQFCLQPMVCKTMSTSILTTNNTTNNTGRRENSPASPHCAAESFTRRSLLTASHCLLCTSCKYSPNA